MIHGEEAMPLPAAVRRNVILNLRAARQSKGVTLENVARRFDLPVGIIADIEAGRTMPSAAEMQIMCRWYGLRIDQIFKPPRPRKLSGRS